MAKRLKSMLIKRLFKKNIYFNIEETVGVKVIVSPGTQ